MVSQLVAVFLAMSAHRWLVADTNVNLITIVPHPKIVETSNATLPANQEPVPLLLIVMLSITDLFVPVLRYVYFHLKAKYSSGG